MNSAATHVLLEAAGRALAAGLVLWLAMRLLRITNAPIQKTAWTMVLCAAIAMPLIVGWQLQPSWAAVHLPITSRSKWLASHAGTENFASVASVAIATEPQTFVGKGSEPEERVVVPAWAFSYPDITSSTVVQSEAPSSKVIAPPVNEPQTKRLYEQLVGFGWLLYLAVGATLLVRLVYGFVSSIRLWIQSEPVEARAALELPTGIEARWSGSIASPVNIGAGILLPADYLQWDDQKLRVVLAHEYAHIRQRDFYLQLLAGLYTAVVWFSPLGWWLKRKLSELGEAISDHASLEAAANPLAYAELLLEFAARPRPSVAGVAMAHSTNLHQRIERVLNESSFRKVFAGSRRSAVVLLLPLVLLAATALVHVQAASIPGQTNTTQAAKSSSGTSADVSAAQQTRTGQSHPDSDQVTDTDSGRAPDAAVQEPALHPAPTPSPTPAPEAEPVPPASPAPVAHVHVSPHIIVTVPPMAPFAFVDPMQIDLPPKNVAGDERAHGDTYSVIGDSSSKWRSHGHPGSDCMSATVQATIANAGHALLVCHQGKPYIIGDQAVLAQVDAMDKAMEDQAEQMKALGKQMREAGEQVRVEARQARETAANIPTPDLSKEMAALNASVADLTAKQGATISREQLAEIQREIAAVQRRLIDAEIKVRVNVDMSKFDEAQSKFNEQMSRMGAEMGRMAHENDEKIRSLIDDCLKNGKAKPVN